MQKDVLVWGVDSWREVLGWALQAEENGAVGGGGRCS